jgi:UDP-glucose 6-dehydrogenase
VSFPKSAYYNHNVETVGFIGQGFIGKAYADDFEKRGFSVVRYSLEPEYAANKEKIKKCGIVFIAVNAATVPSGGVRNDGHPAVRYDDSNVRSTPGLTKPGAIVVIKSTLPPGMTRSIQEEYPDRIVLHSPEFLLETTSATDASAPERNIVGLPIDDEPHRTAATKVLGTLPKAPYELITTAENAELIKYGSNAFLMAKLLFANIFYQLVEKHGGDWEHIREAIGKDPRIGPAHMDLHLKGDPEGIYRRRGAGRSCFIKDWAQLSELYAAAFPEDASAIQALRGLEYKNAELLREYNRYIDLLEGVYGPDAGKKQ